MTNRREFLATALAAASVPLAVSGFAATRSYATKPVRIIVAGPPSGTSDLAARLIGADLVPLLGQPVLVENRPGAGGIIGTKAVADSAPDGHTLLLGHVATNAIVPALYTPKPYDALADFEPVSPLGTAPDLLVVSGSSRFKTVAELLASARRDAPLTYGSAGVGLPQHFSGFMLAKASGVPMIHVPYKGTAPALVGVIGGETSMAIVTSGAAASFIRSGQVRALAVTTAERSHFFPDVPTLRELGFPLAQQTWFGIFAPAHTPKAIVDELNADIGNILARPATRTRLDGLYIDTAKPQSAAAYKAFVTAEAEKWAGIVKTSGITPQ